MGASKRDRNYESISPGPMKYLPKQIKHVSLSYSIAAKVVGGPGSMIQKSIVPGPGTHDPIPVYKSFGNFKYGTE
jgi:hypothetical protein